MILTALGYTLLTLLAIAGVAFVVYVVSEMSDRYPVVIFGLIFILGFLMILLTWVRFLRGDIK